MFTHFPLPVRAESGHQRDGPEEQADRKVFSRNLSNKIKAKKKKRFYFKNRFVGFFFFLHSVRCHSDVTILYTGTQHFLKSLFLMNISKEHCFVMHQWEGRR